MIQTLTPTVALGLERKHLKILTMKSTGQMIDHIFNVLLNETGITEEQMKSRTRKRDVVEARQIAQYLIHRKVGLSLVKTGEIFNRDHSTVIYSLDVIKDLKDTDRQYKARLEIIERAVSGI